MKIGYNPISYETKVFVFTLPLIYFNDKTFCKSKNLPHIYSHSLVLVFKYCTRKHCVLDTKKEVSEKYEPFHTKTGPRIFVIGIPKERLPGGPILLLV